MIAGPAAIMASVWLCRWRPSQDRPHCQTLSPGFWESRCPFPSHAGYTKGRVGKDGGGGNEKGERQLTARAEVCDDPCASAAQPRYLPPPHTFGRRRRARGGCSILVEHQRSPGSIHCQRFRIRKRYIRVGTRGGRTTDTWATLRLFKGYRPTCGRLAVGSGTADDASAVSEGGAPTGG